MPWLTICAAFGYWAERAHECGRDLCDDPIASAAFIVWVLGPVGLGLYWLVAKLWNDVEA